jgi:CheY-like chemotaxis protein
LSGNQQQSGRQPKEGLLVNILIVVNNESAEKEYRQLLAVARHQDLVTASTKAQALWLCNQAQFDAVVVHGDPSDATGPETISYLKKLPQRPARIIGVPTNPTFPRQLPWKQAGPDALLEMELDHLELLKALGVQFSPAPIPD